MMVSLGTIVFFRGEGGRTDLKTNKTFKHPQTKVPPESYRILINKAYE